jgi:type IV secretion system protein VirB9
MKKVVLSAVIAMALAGTTFNAAALQAPKSSPYDFRIKTVVYNPVDVVRIDAVAGLFTHIVVSRMKAISLTLSVILLAGFSHTNLITIS